MKILDAKIYWGDGYCNAPHLNVLVDKIPSRKELTYKRMGPLYFAEKDGFVDYFYYAAPGDGYGGTHFTINVEGEGEIVLKGPWSSGSHTMNQHFIHSMEVGLTDDPEVMKRGHTFYGAHITIEAALDACRFVQGSSLVGYTKYGTILYCVTKLGEPEGRTVKVIGTRDDAWKRFHGKASNIDLADLRRVGTPGAGIEHIGGGASDDQISAIKG